MASNKTKAPREYSRLEDDVKAALRAAVARFGSQSKVAEALSVTGPVVSMLLADKYPGSVDQMSQRIRGEFMGDTVLCPVLGNLSKRNCLDNQALPQAFTNPVRAALGRACKTCSHRKDLS